MANNLANNLKDTLEKLYNPSILKEFIKDDPIEFPHLFQDPCDIEVAGFIASTLAFGRIELFKRVVRKILSIPDGSLYDFMVNFHPVKDGVYFKNLYYRMCRERDILAFIYILSEILRKYGSLENLLHTIHIPDSTIRHSLTKFISILREVDTTSVYGENLHPRGLLQLLPSPESGGACKRLNMFLRWMVRPADGIDFGIWNFIPASILVIPVDTHIARISKGLGITSKKSISWIMAEEITGEFRKVCPEDPLKYDFALCHLGINGKWKEVLLNERK